MIGRGSRTSLFAGMMAMLGSAGAVAQLPGSKSIPPPPALTALAGQIVVPALQPGGQIALRLSGGAAPFEVTIATASHSTLFGIVRTADTTKTESGRLPLLVSVSTTLQSASELLGVRFKGVSVGTALPAQIPISVSVRDALSRMVSVSTTLYPVTPRLAIGDSFSSGITRQALSVSLQIQGIPPGMRVALRGGLFPGLTVAETACLFMFNPAAPTITADSFGNAVFTGLQGAFGARPGTSEQGPCTFAVEATVGPAGGAQAFLLKKTGITLAAPVVHEVTSTGSLRELMGFESRSTTLLNGSANQDLGYPDPVGVCYGVSGPDPVKVGNLIDANGDLSFTIRSGPLGTVCEWRSKLTPIGNGLQLQSLRWSVSKVGSKCCSGAVARCDPVQSPSTMSTAAMILVTGSSSADDDFFDDSGAARIAATIDGSRATAVSPSEWGKYELNPVTVHLHCDPTVLNDHGITLRLESVTVRGPPGSRFP